MLVVFRYIPLLIFILFLDSVIYAQHPVDIPVLCYHNIKPAIGKHQPAYTIDTTTFAGHMQMLYDNGYSTILPTDIYHAQTAGSQLPDHPIIISFDDSHAEQYLYARPIMQRHGFRGVFFILLVTVDKPGYMSQEMIKNLKDSGNEIGGHTWDHPDLRKSDSVEWERQVYGSNLKLSKLVGAPITSFAYPFGAWNRLALIRLNREGILTAFQLRGHRDTEYPFLTLRRLMVNGSWHPLDLKNRIENTFR